MNRWELWYNDGRTPRDHRMIVEADYIDQALEAPTAPPKKSIFAVRLLPATPARVVLCSGLVRRVSHPSPTEPENPPSAE